MQNKWWKGSRGEWFVVLQVLLFLLVIFGPVHWPGAREWPASLQKMGQLAGWFLLPAGGLLTAAGIFRLGANLTPVPYPKDQGTLIQSGPYALVRHPIYSGGVFAAVGWALLAHGSLTLGYAAVLFVFFDIKSRREERWLTQKYPDYQAYQQKVRKLIPFLY